MVPTTTTTNPSFWSRMSNWFTDGENLQGLGSVLGAAGQGYAALEQSKAAKAMLDLENRAYYDELKRREDSKKAVASAWGDPTAASLPLGG